MSQLKTIFEFIKNLRTTGAIAETSEEVEQEISSLINKEIDKTIVEFGLGHGNITRAILNKMADDASLYTFEINKDFIHHVSTQIDDPRLNYINSSAETIDQHINQSINTIISSIPLTFFSTEKSNTIVRKAYNCLNNGGSFSQILYSKKEHLFKSSFETIEIVKVKNIPPAYIHHCIK